GCHDLETSCLDGIDPTCLIGHAVGHHASQALEPLADGFGVLILEPLDYHEQHCWALRHRWDVFCVLSCASRRNAVRPAGSRWRARAAIAGTVTRVRKALLLAVCVREGTGASAAICLTGLA